MKEESKSPQNIDEYIANFPPAVQAILEKIRATVHEAAPSASEAISYQMPTFKQGGNLVHFAAFKNHIGFYPTPSGIERFGAELAAYHKSKGTIQFPLDQPIPYELISAIVRARVEETQAKAAAKKKK